MALVSPPKKIDDVSVRQAISKLASIKLGPTSTPTFASVTTDTLTTATLTVSDLTASRLVATNGSKALASVGDLTSWIAGTANEIDVADDSDGTITLSLGGNMGDISALTPTDGYFIVGDGTNWVTESENTARTSLGLGTGDSPTFTDLVLSDWQLGTPTYNSVHDWMNTIQSAGRISGGDFTDNEDGTLTVAAGTGMIKTTDSRTGVTLMFDWEENTDVQTDEETPEGLTDQATNHIYVDYKSGSPQIFCTTSISDISFTDKIGLGRVYRDGTSLHMLPGGAPTNDVIQRTHQAIAATLQFHRSSGLQISETGDLGIAITEGVFWRGLRDFPVFTGTGYDSTETDFTLWYNDGAWQSSQTGVLTHHYNDYGTGLVATGAQKYGNFWVYICHDGHVHVVYGLGNYKYAEAIAAAAPANLPTIVSDFAMLLARITVKTEETSTFTNISTPWDSEIISGTVTTHDSLSNLDFASSGHTGFQENHANLDNLSDLTYAAASFVKMTGANTFALRTIGETADDLQGTIDHDSLLNVHQDVNTDALPTFAGLTINGTIATGLDMSGGTFATAIQNWPATPVINIAGVQAIKFDDTSFNILIGSSAFINDNGTYNVGIGYQAGYYNDTIGADYYGDNNVYIGYQSGFGATGGNNNTGYRNVGIGEQTLYYNTSGYGNVAIGWKVLYSNTTGYRNVGTGREALYNNTTGHSNFALGYRALYKNTDGLVNTAIGISALVNNIDGDSNIGIGYLVGQGNETGNYNVLIGTLAGARGQVGLDNFSNNIFIGYRSGYNIQTASNSIYIGYRSGYNQTTNDNLLIIDNQDRTSAALEITNCLIYGVFNATPASQTLRFNVGNLYLGNPVHSDADGGGAVIQSFIREDGAGTPSTAATITGSHDGAGANDTKGKLVIATDSGAGLVTALTIDSAQLATFTGDITANNLSGSNTGDQTSIAGITGTKAQFDAACTDGDFMYVGGAPTAHLHDGDTLECDGINSSAGAFAFDTGGLVTFNNSILLDTGADLQVSGHVIFNTNLSYIGFTNPRITFDDTNDKLVVTGGLELTNEITEFSTDGTMGDNSDSALPTEAAVVTYTAAQLATFTGQSNIVTVGAIGTGTWEATDVAIAHGGTGQSTAQAAINALSAVGAATNEYVFTKDTGTGNAIWKEAISGDEFVNRGDPGAADYTHATLTLDNAWHDLDLSSIVPADATAVLLAVVVKDNAVGSRIKFRTNGNSNIYNVSQCYTTVVDAYTAVDCAVACDSNRIIEYDATTDCDYISIVVKGWFVPASTSGGASNTPQFDALGIKVAAPSASQGALKIYASTVNTDEIYYGLYNHHIKTAGVTDADDWQYGLYNKMVYNQSGGVIGHPHAFRNEFQLVDGNVGDVSNERSLYLNYSFANLDGGKIWGKVRGLESKIQQEIGNEVTGDVFGNYIWIGMNGTVGGTTYGVYVYEVAGVDYGFYQNGTAMNVLGGPLKVALKSGTNQGAAGAVAGELWHDTTDNTVKMGV